MMYSFECDLGDLPFISRLFTHIFICDCNCGDCKYLCDCDFCFYRNDCNFYKDDGSGCAIFLKTVRKMKKQQGK